MKRLSSDQIDEYYKLNINYGGWFNKDTLPKLENKFYIINMQSSGEGSGTHWVLVYNVKHNFCIYFDSFGIDPPKDVLQRMKETNKECVMSDVEIQNLDSMMCGYYCINVIDRLENGESYTDIVLSDYSFDTLKNENIIKKINGGDIKTDLLKKLLIKRPTESYTTDIKNAIHLIEMQDTIPYGSFNWKSVEYPTDIDLMSHVEECCDLESASTKIVKLIQDKIKLIDKNSKTFLGDIKAGTDERYKIDIGNFINGKTVNYDSEQIKLSINELYKNKLLTKQEYDYVIPLLKHNINYHDFDLLHEFLRDKYILRWTKQDILNGYIILVGNIKKSLKMAIRDNTAVKIDMWAPIDGKYVEVTNFLFLSYRDSKNKKHIINLQEDEGFTREIRAQIARLSSKEHFKPMKLAKRIFSLSRYINDYVTYKKILPLFQSSTAELGQILSEIDTLILMLSNIDKQYFPFDIVIKQIDFFKTRIAKINDIKFDDKKCYHIIDDIVNHYKNMSNIHIINNLNLIINYLTPIVNKNVIEYMEYHSLYPVRPTYLPQSNDGGIILKTAFSLYGSAKDRVEQFVKGARENAPPSIRKWLEQNGDKKIIDITICRTPVQSYVTKSLNYLSFGRFEEIKKNLKYSDMFHLYMFIKLDNGKTYRIEKNEVARLTETNKIDGESKHVRIKSFNLSEFINNGFNMQPSNFWLYDPKLNNCQTFIKSLLDGNHINNNELNSFVLQDAVKIFEHLPAYLTTVARKTTDLASRADILVNGKGVKRKNQLFKIFKAKRVLTN